jgi:hypothetical protein
LVAIGDHTFPVVHNDREEYFNRGSRGDQQQYSIRRKIGDEYFTK